MIVFNGQTRRAANAVKDPHHLVNNAFRVKPVQLGGFRGVPLLDSRTMIFYQAPFWSYFVTIGLGVIRNKLAIKIFITIYTNRGQENKLLCHE
jgi:hypothetical protein